MKIEILSGQYETSKHHDYENDQDFKTILLRVPLLQQDATMKVDLDTQEKARRYSQALNRRGISNSVRGATLFVTKNGRPATVAIGRQYECPECHAVFGQHQKLQIHRLGHLPKVEK